MIALLILTFLSHAFVHDSIEEQWLGCKTTVRCDEDVCLVRFYCP